MAALLKVSDNYRYGESYTHTCRSAYIHIIRGRSAARVCLTDERKRKVKKQARKKERQEKKETNKRTANHGDSSVLCTAAYL